MVSALYIVLGAILLIKLSIDVVKLRMQYRVAYGDGGFYELQTAIRVHGNAVEYIPIAAILLVLMLLMGTHIPQPVSRMLENAASVVMKATPQQTFQWPWAASRATSSNHSDCTRECTGEMK